MFSSAMLSQVVFSSVKVFKIIYDGVNAFDAPYVIRYNFFFSLLFLG